MLSLKPSKLSDHIEKKRKKQRINGWMLIQHENFVKNQTWVKGDLKKQTNNCLHAA